MTPIDLQMITSAAAVLACLCAVLVARRAGAWRETDAAKQLVARVDSHDLAIASIKQKVEGMPNQSQIASIEERIKNLATKAEIASIQSDVHSLVREVGKVDAGVTRIEAFLMEHGK